MNERDILTAICGINDNGRSKAITAIRMVDVDVETGEDYKIDEFVIDSPVVNIYRTIDKTMLDLTFPGNEEYDLVNTAGRLNTFIDAEATPACERLVRSIVVSVTPKDDYPEYYSSGVNATWVVMPKSPGTDPDTIRFIFDNEFFGTYQILLSEDESADEDYEEVQ